MTVNEESSVTIEYRTPTILHLKTHNHLIFIYFALQKHAFSVAFF